MAVSSSTPFRRAQNTTSSFYGEKCAEVCDDGLLTTTPGASVRHTRPRTRASSSLHSNARCPATDERDDHPARDQGWRDGRDASSQRAPRWRLGPRRADPDVRRGGPRYAHERWCVHFGARFVRLPHLSVLPASRLLFPSPSRPRVPSSSPFSSSTAAAAATVAPR